ncbi:MAG: hypothetical protein IPN08_06415 [Bacteroidales bacterium]|nr:hypothetical protein [Bacteroidales bacterium]
MLISLNISAQETVTLNLPLTSGEKASTPYNIASFEFGSGSAIDTVFFDPSFGAMSGGWNSPSLNPEAYYEYRIAPAEGASLSLRQVRLDISLGRGEMRTAVKYSTDGFRSAGIAVGQPVFFTTTTPRTLPLTTELTVSYPDTLSIRVYAWSARNRNISIAAMASGPQLLAVVENIPLVTESEPTETSPKDLPASPAGDTTAAREIPVSEEPSMAQAIAPVQDTLFGGNNGIIMAPMGITVITSSGTWQVPANVYEITVECWGGGGGGGGARYGAGGGGGGGAYNKITFTTNVNPGDWYTITIGAGGTTGNNANGGPGGITSFTGLAGTISANGGSGGNRGSGSGIFSLAYGAGGTGGTGGIYNGGNGGTSTSNGAGGGGGAGNNGDGTNGSNTGNGIGGAGNPNMAPYIGGNGGARINNNNPGNPGNIPGGGGSGARSGNNTPRSGGSGARGQIIITWPDCINPVAPSTANVDRDNFCSDDAGNIVLSYSGGSGTILNWYAGGCGAGSAIGSGNNLSIASPNLTTTYYARWESDPCLPSACAAVTVTVIPSPIAPVSATVNRNNFCADDAGNIILSYTGGSGTIPRWYEDGCGSGTSIGSGNNLSIVSPTTTTTYYARWETDPCSPSACASITVTVVQSPVAPSTASVDRNNFCSDDAGSIILSYTGGSGTTLNWYSGGCGVGASLGSGNNLSIASPVITTTYYARWEAPPCGASACAEVTVTVRPVPVAPVSVSSDINPICVNAGSNITLTANGGSGTTLRWFTGSCGGTAIGTGTTLTIPSPVVTTTYLPDGKTIAGILPVPALQLQ